MSVALKRRPMTRAEFLAWEERQEFRYEFDGNRPEAMTGGTDRHSAIQVRLIAALYVAVRGSPYQVFNSDMMIDVAGSYRYPDALVAAGALDGQRIKRDLVVRFQRPTPKVMIVLSSSRGAKRRGDPGQSRRSRGWPWVASSRCSSQ